MVLETASLQEFSSSMCATCLGIFKTLLTLQILMEYMIPEIRIEDYSYELPEERIAKYPLEERDSSKLLVYKDGDIRDSVFRRLPEELPSFCHQIQSYENLIPSGLMTIAPICDSAEEYSFYFSEMEHLRHTVFTSYFPQIQHPILSMGMSGSYLPALANGADIIRIGEGIFGKRNTPCKIIAKRPTII